MGVRALRPTQEATDAADPAEPRAGSPATRLLDALRAGDDAAALATCGVATTVTADNMTWSCQGSDEIQSMIALARARFPGLTFESRTRHVGFGLVIEEARVRDVRIDDPSDIDDATEAADQGDDESPHAEAHPMWDEPVAEQRGALTLWKDGHDDAPPAPLNMPVRVTVRHDDIQVHEITLGFPAALLKRALGKHVDPLEISLSEVQSAFIAPVGAGFTTHTLERPELTLVPTRSAEPEPEPVDPKPPRRRRRVLVPLALALLAVLAGAGWWTVQGSDRGNAAAPPVPSPTSGPTSQPTPSASTSPRVSPSSKPSQPVTAPPTRKPNVTLKSDLAFGFNSAQLSSAAKTAIARVAHQVRRAGLTGRIYVDGYTDDLGSSSYGQVLSQKRADAVASYLRSHLGSTRVSVVPVGHGEANPIASNATAAGRQQNRRVTITLPKA